MQLSAHLFYFYFWERAKRNQVFQRAVKHVCNWIIMKLRVNKNKILPHDCLLNIFTKQSNMWVVRRFALINRFMQQSQARFHQNLSWLRVVDIKFTSKLQVFTIIIIDWRTEIILSWIHINGLLVDTFLNII